MSAFTDALLTAARGTLGIHEEGGKNRGPRIDEWNTAVHAPVGSPWCAAWVFGMHAIAATSCGVTNFCPQTAGALKLWHRGISFRVPMPVPGSVFVLDTGDPGGFGHVGIVEVVSPSGDLVVSIEGNTNDAGSREGNTVARHSWRPSEEKRGKLMGYLSFDPTVGVDALPKSPFG